MIESRRLPCVAPEVVEAVSAGRPVVALESTLISHGMPYPAIPSLAARIPGTLAEQVRIRRVWRKAQGASRKP